jgi:signal transduction histidine kinase/HAMP domain-containing protein
MPGWRQSSIQTRLIFIMMLTSMTAVLLVGIITAVLSLFASRQNTIDNLESIARVLGNNCQVALMFALPQDAVVVLSGLQAHATIDYACLYDAAGGVFATFSGPALAAPPAPPPPLPGGVVFAGKSLGLFYAIVLDGRHIGTLYLRDNLQVFFRTLKRHGIVLLLIMLCALGSTYFIARRLQRVVTRPILTLAATAARVSASRDYGIRAAVSGPDEIGTLVEAFNDMLAQIQRRDEALGRSNLLLSSVIESPENIWIYALDADLRYTLFNERHRDIMRSLMGADIGEGRSILHFLPPAHHAKAREHLQRALRGERFAGEQHIGFGQARQVYKVFFNPIVDEGARVSGVTVFAVDITELKQAEAEIARHRDNLEALVQERSRALEAAQQELVQAERLSVLGRLTATVSHELRNPLGVMRTSVFYLSRTLRDLEAKNRKHLERIEEQIGLCEGIVDELLEYTRGRLSEKTPGDINPLVEEALSLARLQHRAVICCDLAQDLSRVAYDGPKMRRVVHNLLANALQAVEARAEQMRREGRPYDPAVRMATMAADAGVCITIADNGIGMDADTARRAFEPLFTTRARGTGLGLAIVKKIVEEHDGVITLESTPLQGTTVRLVLPCAAP